MEFRHLETFYWIACLGSFAAAAQKLHTTQPSVSMRIRELERSLGTKLFDTSRRSATLTPKGRELVQHAENVLALVSTIKSRMADTKMLSGRVRVGVTETIALTWLPAFVARMKDRFPNVVLELDVDLTANVWSKLSAGTLEVVLVPGPVAHSGYIKHYLGNIQYTWMASPKLALPDGPLTPAELASLPVLSLSSASKLFSDMEHWFQANRTPPARVDLCNSLSVVASLTMDGLGISLLPPSIFDAQVQAGNLVVLNTRPPIDPLDFYLVYSERQVSPLPVVIAEVAESTSTFAR